MFKKGKAADPKQKDAAAKNGADDAQLNEILERIGKLEAATETVGPEAIGKLVAEEVTRQVGEIRAQFAARTSTDLPLADIAESDLQDVVAALKAAGIKVQRIERSTDKAGTVTEKIIKAATPTADDVLAALPTAGGWSVVTADGKRYEVEA